jgi:protein phosphatase
VRLSNQDSFAVLSGAQAPPGLDALLVIADGMGGHRGGGVASSLAVSAVTSFLAAEAGDGANPDERTLLRWAGDAIRRANAVIYEAAASDAALSGMGTTCTLALACGASLAFGHVGDSRALLLSNGQLTQLTADHSWVAYEVREGRMAAEEAEHHPRKNLLLQAVGPQPHVEPDVFLYRPRSGDVVVMCSDGLSNALGAAEIAALSGNLDVSAACAALIAAANERGADDNVTVVLARLEV